MPVPPACPRCLSKVQSRHGGYDTDTALRSGALRGVAAELEYYRLQAPAGSAVVLTGGDAEAVGKLVGFNYIIEKNLVLLGLNRILHHHNEA